MKKIYMGDRFFDGDDECVVARTESNIDENVLAFQLVCISEGNRYSDGVVLVTKGTHDGCMWITIAQFAAILGWSVKETSELVAKGYLRTNSSYRYIAGVHNPERKEK